MLDRVLLSVSSVGSEAMQRDIEETERILSDLLSVSSVGSEAMQLKIADRVTPLEVSNFQYPRSDRRRCNLAGRKAGRLNHPHLSVSSVGSEAMQR